ncbi:glucosaminidase domain-containing protein [Gorillibacterium timonense]|uniref:glucosaminidase domain-containing protein n=1 Tax=Gorillibacterium timonense TaxID=1689269 RepID=UPI00071D872F|nr:glucosaminidase domain-containing protein [Gorillibacterium timonense]
MAFSCATKANGSQLDVDTFINVYGKYASWASGATKLPYALILIQFAHESNWGKANIGTPYNNPANYGVSGPNNPYSNICFGTSSGYIVPMTSTSKFKVNAVDGSDRTAAKYVLDAYKNGYTVPATNRYGSVPGAGTKLAAGFQAACAAMGAMGWAESYYYNSGSTNVPKTAGNILMRWYDLYLKGKIADTTIGSNTVPSCCDFPPET